MSDVLMFALRARWMRLCFLLSLAIPTMLYASYQTYIILEPNQLRAIEIAQLTLAFCLYIWLSISFWTSIIGFILKLSKRDPLSLKRERHVPSVNYALTKKYAVVMPVYNEDTNRIMAGFAANALALDDHSQGKQFDFFMLSDTQDEQLINKEQIAWPELLKTLPKSLQKRCFYRLRQENTGRKVGNIKDFCQRWGYAYEGMIVLDADSLMTASKMVELAQRLEVNKNTGLIQTIPMPIRQSTFFGRFVQFAAQTHSPMLATGLSFWQGDCANYWGHNAILRIDAFLATCGLPRLTGAGPFGGEILSHDFVEAALLRRAGWRVYLLTDDRGSYEEVPSNIIDYLVRDRRWIQGNVQHLAVFTASKLKLTNRLHMVFGAFAYISSIFLFALLLLGTIDAVAKTFEEPIYFTETYQLFPTWLITKKTVMLTTLYVTIALLFLPKLLGVLITLLQRSKTMGGRAKFLISAIIEFLFSFLLAPVMMVFHCFFVINVLMGKSVKWDAQSREGRTVPFGSALKYTWPLTMLGLAWAGVTFYYVMPLFYWLLPVYSGLILAPLIIKMSSSLTLGLWMQRCGLFLIPEELKPVAEMKSLTVFEQKNTAPNLDASNSVTGKLPVESFSDMPIQSL